MKQHITEEQVLSLTDKQKCEMSIILYPKRRWQEWVWSQAAELLTIGKMIEILEIKMDTISIMQEPSSLGEPNKVWWVTGSIIMLGYEFGEYELVDALWEAVKEII